MFAEFIALIEGFGFVQERISGSHHIFSYPHISQPDSNGQAQPYQLKQFMKLIEKYNLRLNDEQSNTLEDQTHEETDGGET